MSVAVFGATGSVGTQVCISLANRNIPFKALVHNIQKAEKIKELKGAELFQGDYCNSETVDNFLKNVASVFLLTHSAITEQCNEITYIAKKNGVKHIVKVSGLGAEQEDPSKFIWAYEHRLNEEYIKKSGLNYTILRPSGFTSNYLRNYYPIKDTFINNLGDAKINNITPEDIAEVAATILEDPSKHNNQIYTLTGVDTVSFFEIAKIFSEVLGKEMKYQPNSTDEMRQHFSKFLPPQALDGWMNMHTYFANGGYDCKTDDVEKILGRKPQDIKYWLNQNIAAFK